MSLDELKKLPQWCCSATKEDKAPRDVFGKLASTADPNTWDTYENCKNAGFPFTGFVLTPPPPLLRTSFMYGPYPVL
jgi:hypothetical protein